MSVLKILHGLLKRAKVPLLCLAVGSQIFIIVAIFSAATYLLAQEDPSATHSPSRIQAIASTLVTVEKRVLSGLPLLPLSKKEAPLVAAIIENHEDARPQQAGLRDAEVVFELSAEGDISRFLALFRADDLPDSIGPVRSLRLHFVSLLDPYASLLLHIGGHPLAYDALRKSTRIIDHDGIRYDGETFERSKEFAPPHNLFMEKEALLSILTEKKEELPSTPFPLYPVKQDLPPDAENALTIFLNFGSPVHDVTYTFDRWKHEYKRSIDGAPIQATPENIVILEADVQGYGTPGAIPWTNTYGQGHMILFRNGKKIEGIWKRTEGEPLEFLTTERKVLPLTPGQVWITMLPSLRMVENAE
jgi:hypothetical protein